MHAVRRASRSSVDDLEKLTEPGFRRTAVVVLHPVAGFDRALRSSRTSTPSTAPAKGFRVVGEIQQDLDLFRMPVELKIDTDGKTETKQDRGGGNQLALRGGDLRQAAAHHSSIPTTEVLKNTPELQPADRHHARPATGAAGQPGRVAAASSKRRSTSTRTARWRTTASPRSSSCSATTRRRPTPTAMRSTAMASRAGPRSGATSSSARSSTSPASASAQSTSISRRCRLTTTPRARSTRPANTCRRPTSARTTAAATNQHLTTESQRH